MTESISLQSNISNPSFLEAGEVEVKEFRPRNDSLGHVQLYNTKTKERILVPEPSIHPDDPLTWSKGHKMYITCLVSYVMVLANFLSGGPSMAIVQMAETWGEQHDGADYDLTKWISKTAYCFTSTALLQGTSNFFWVPLMTKYGKRPVYMTIAVGYFAFTLACGFAKNYNSYLAFRILLGFFSGGNEVLGPLTISDVFYTHERGTQMAIYTCALSLGIALGMIVSGAVVKSYSWRYIYYIGGALIGSTIILIFFTLPETTFIRVPDLLVSAVEKKTKQEVEEKCYVEHAEIECCSSLTIPKKTPYLSTLKIYSGKKYTNESLWRIFIRPIGLIILPGVLWASLIMAATIGFLTAVVSNVATAYESTYNFEAWQGGLCFFGAFIGSILGIFAGGHISDWWTDALARRNNGLRVPEMRLQSLVIGGVLTPVALILYGVGINNKYHWMVPTLGLSILNFSLTQATNVSLVYAIDCYRPIVGEITVTQLAFKSMLGFLLNFYTNPWIDKYGYSKAYGEMAAISGILFLLTIPLYFYGDKLRNKSYHWKILKFIHWNSDREVGE